MFDSDVYILASDVMEAIAELKARITDLEGLNHVLCERVTENDGIRQHWEEIEQTRAENERLKQKLESVQASMYADVVDANMENRRLRRALWIARAKRAIEKIALFKLWDASISTMNPEDGTRQEFDKWKKNLGKFLKEAEEYK
jgi:uncharacterized coiled-coil protein SlyX